MCHSERNAQRDRGTSVPIETSTVPLPGRRFLGRAARSARNDTTTSAMFSVPKPVIAMVHVGALPGTPAGGATLRELEERAAAECAVYRDAGVHGVMLENMHDV